MSHFIGVPSTEIDTHWPAVEPLVAQCLDKVEEYRYEPADILDALRERDMQLWAAVEWEPPVTVKVKAILITQLVVYPRAKECELFIWAGERTPDWKEHLAKIEEWAREQGCHYMSSRSRPGSAKVTGYSKGMIHAFRRL